MSESTGGAAPPWARVLVICKRRPQQRDLVARPYGRFEHLPEQLAASGAQISMLLLDHRSAPAFEGRRNGVHWIAPGGPLAGARWLIPRSRDWRRNSPFDWVMGASDLWHGVLAWRIARRTGARLLIDAYDNFESYMPLATPVHRLWRTAVSEASVVTAAGPKLAARLGVDRAKAPVVVPMAADPGFEPMAMRTCRTRLGLPMDAPLVGYVGSADTKRDLPTLFAAMSCLRATHPSVRLVMTGRRDRAVRLPDGVLHLGYVADALLPTVFGSLSVVCVCGADNAFGRFSYPAKLYEALACRRPVAAAATGPIRWILGPSADSTTYTPGCARSLAECLVRQLNAPSFGPRPPGWSSSGKILETAMREAAPA
ncbi:MAG: glycosyltransferase family 4 protein [Abyssibacter sp.]|nr:glycosyltransferase family 4 protein [Abyssibacter sp.]MCK5858777.1 glycosyltransferase family 4 protein [Abyssibacter sp.]